MDDPHWRRAVQLAEQVLHARPQDPVALTALAAADMAHGRTETGQAYLVAAQQAMAPAEASDQLLARTRDHVRAALRYLGEED
jgi:protein O-GlcNAc transferase